MRERVERLPWVRRVAVRRIWPGRLEVSVEEHVALARWGGTMNRLVNTFGETFSAKPRSAARICSSRRHGGRSVWRYHRFSELVAPLGTGVERVVLTQRLAWQLRLGNGLTSCSGATPTSPSSG